MDQVCVVVMGWMCCIIFLALNSSTLGKMNAIALNILLDAFSRIKRFAFWIKLFLLNFVPKGHIDNNLALI